MKRVAGRISRAAVRFAEAEYPTQVFSHSVLALYLIFVVWGFMRHQFD